MISHLRGTLVSASPTCIVSVGGVGFEVQVPERDRATLLDTPSEVAFHTYLYVREDRLELFGFLESRDRELFVRLIDVSGIGPKIAINILGEASSARLVRAIREKDTGFLCKLPGLGKKTAERLSMELRDKLDNFDAEVAPGRTSPDDDLREEVLLALTSLGLTRGAAERALDKIDWSATNSVSVEDVVKQALRHTSAV